MLGFLAPLLGLAGKGIGKGISALFGGSKPKIDPTMAAMMGLSLLDGGDNTLERKSFRDPGSHIDPIQGRQEAREALLRLGQGLTEKPGVRLRSSYVQRGPSPVQIQGVPFQIGGGLGTDPALADPSLLQGRSVQEMGIKDDPFQSLAATRRRTPPGGNF